MDTPIGQRADASRDQGSARRDGADGQIEKTQSEHIRELVHFRIRTEQNLAEITDKLNGLVGYVAGQKPSDPKSH